MKYLSKDGLRYYHQKKVKPTIKSYIDKSLDKNSENAISNKVVTAEFEKIKLTICGGSIASDTAPEKTDVLWIDTSSGGVVKYYDKNSNTWVTTKSVWG